MPIFSLSASDRLPHLYPAADLDRLFPRYEVPAEDIFVTGGGDLGGEEQAQTSRSPSSGSSSPLGNNREDSRSRLSPFNGT